MSVMNMVAMGDQMPVRQKNINVSQAVLLNMEPYKSS